MPFALSIAGSDPTGGAGLQADLQVFRALGVHGGAVVSALTVQDGRPNRRIEIRLPAPSPPAAVLVDGRPFADWRQDGGEIVLTVQAAEVELSVRGATP